MNDGFKVVLVPNELRDAINTLLDEVVPDDCPHEGRTQMYHQLLCHFHETGTLPTAAELRVIPGAVETEGRAELKRCQSKRLDLGNDRAR